MNNSYVESLSNGLQLGFIDKNLSLDSECKPKLVLNNPPKIKVLSTLKKELSSCKSFDFSVAFINSHGVASILEELNQIKQKNIRGRILSTDYLNFTEPKALKKLAEFPNIELRLYKTEDFGSFHSKGYIFYQDTEKTQANVIIGSANLTGAALSTTREWNIQFSALSSGDLLSNIQSEFESAWEVATPYSESLYIWYSEVYKAFHDSSTYIPIPGTGFNSHIDKTQKRIIPNSMQVEALDSLNDLRFKGENKALVISATGTGKTYLCAFDVKQFAPKKCLFIVHRENILEAAMNSFKKVLGGPDSDYGYFKSDKKNSNAKYVFAMIQTIGKLENLNLFAKDEFDYIIIDEAHHIQESSKSTYKQVLNYFKPSFLLGLTATPERTDTYNIFKDFNHNIAYEIRLNQALDLNLLCPFHYYGVSDLYVDGHKIDDTSATNINDLVCSERIKLILEKLSVYTMDKNNVKGLIFCSRVEEAQLLSVELNKHNLKTIALSGANTEEERTAAIKRLELPKTDSNYLDYIITRDIFNEGIDIPQINQVVMLRPTQSVIVYIQQLGRGLRLAEGKDFLTVIDFIGNYRNNFFIPVALFGERSYRRSSLEKDMIKGSSMLMGVSTIDFDQIAKEKIYSAINGSSYSDSKFLKHEYLCLKDRLGRIPNMMDFISSDSISPEIYLNKYDNYARVLSKYEEDFKWDYESDEDASLTFFSSIISNGIRPYETAILRLLIEKEKFNFSEYSILIKNSFGFAPNYESFFSCLRILTNQFFGFTFKNKSHNISYCVYKDKNVEISSKFKLLLENKEYKKQLEDLLNFSDCEYKNHFLIDRENDDLILYQKYTRQDVCRILNWEKDESSTIYGYKVDSNTKTCPIFVTYNKDSDNISATTNYSDRFTSKNIFSWQTRTGKTKIKEEVEQISGRSELGKIRIPLFITKDKKRSKDKSIDSAYHFLVDGGTTYHYYVGDVTYQYSMESKKEGKDIFDVLFSMNTPLSQEMFDYFESIKRIEESESICNIS